MVNIEESYITQIEYGFDSHDVEIIDTAGQEEFMLFRDTALAQGDAFLALFAINSISSWYSLQELRDKIVREHDDEEEIPMVIVANKNVRSSVVSTAIVLSLFESECAKLAYRFPLL